MPLTLVESDRLVSMVAELSALLDSEDAGSQAGTATPSASSVYAAAEPPLLAESSHRGSDPLEQILGVAAEKSSIMDDAMDLEVLEELVHRTGLPEEFDVHVGDICLDGLVRDIRLDALGRLFCCETQGATVSAKLDAIHIGRGNAELTISIFASIVGCQLNVADTYVSRVQALAEYLGLNTDLSSSSPLDQVIDLKMKIEHALRPNGRLQTLIRDITTFCEVDPNKNITGILFAAGPLMGFPGLCVDRVSNPEEYVIVDGVIGMIVDGIIPYTAQVHARVKEVSNTLRMVRELCARSEVNIPEDTTKEMILAAAAAIGVRPTGNLPQQVAALVRAMYQ